MAYKNEAFIKVVNGVKAPSGFHYMAGGRFMNDNDHIAKYGYIEKKIKSVSVNYKDLDPGGDSRDIEVRGDDGFVFSIEVYEGNRASYYNFKTKTWGAASYMLTSAEGVSGKYTTIVDFPSQASLKTFTINVYGETVENIRTTHKPFLEVRNPDGSLNLNLSTGSDSNIVSKTLYQDVLKNLYLSCIAPSLYTVGKSNIGAVVDESNRVTVEEDVTAGNVVAVGDKITVTGIAFSAHALVLKINPDNDNVREIEISKIDSVDDGREATFTPAFNGVTPHYTDSTSGRQALEVVSLSSASFGFTITVTAPTSRGLSLLRLPTAEDLCAINLVTFEAAALAIPGENVSSSTYYRWPITNIANLGNGMFLDPARLATGGFPNTTTPASISDYTTTKTVQTIYDSSKYQTDFSEETVTDIFVAGVDRNGSVVTAVDRNGRVTAQKGNIVFSVKQKDVLKGDSNVRIIAQGTKSIEKTNGMGVALSNVAVTKTTSRATVTQVATATTTIPLDEVDTIVVGTSIRGVGIDSTVANPTVVSKSVASGSGTIVVSAAQTLENGVVLSFDGPTSSLVIKGIIHVTDMPITDTTLYFDLERFLICA